MTTPITITTRQTEELIRKWARADKTTQTVNRIALISWAVISIARIVMGIARPDDWMNWVLAALAAIMVSILIHTMLDPAFSHQTRTTTLTLSDQSVGISIDKYGKTKGYSVNWNKVRIHETDDCFVYLVNFRQMQIFRKEDLTDCTVEELSAFFAEKLGKRYVKL